MKHSVILFFKASTNIIRQKRCFGKDEHLAYYEQIQHMFEIKNEGGEEK